MKLSKHLRPLSLLVIFCSFTTLLTGCLHAPNPDTRTEDELALRKLDAQWSVDAGSHNLRATVDYYADGAVLLAPDEPVAIGKPAIRDSWAKTLAAFETLSWQIRTIEVARAGDFAYITGGWHGSFKFGAGPEGPVTGKLLEVWKKQPDGNWKCVADTFNYDARYDATLAPPPTTRK